MYTLCLYNVASDYSDCDGRQDVTYDTESLLRIPSHDGLTSQLCIIYTLLMIMILLY